VAKFKATEDIGTKPNNIFHNAVNNLPDVQGRTEKKTPKKVIWKKS